LRLIDASPPRVLALRFSAVLDIACSALNMPTESEEGLRKRRINLVPHKHPSSFCAVLHDALRDLDPRAGTTEYLKLAVGFPVLH
jgi:hypothetical protein